ncbi:hypothetical protein FGB62_154g08 [Gracilaria domingensis]|nr:hypothetical protein FGB62_154g08 [Gracilaria domingensis]
MRIKPHRPIGGEGTKSLQKVRGAFTKRAADCRGICFKRAHSLVSCALAEELRYYIGASGGDPVVSADCAARNAADRTPRGA